MPRTRTRLTERRNKNQFNSSNVSNKATTNTINYKKKVRVIKLTTSGLVGVSCRKQPLEHLAQWREAY